jgi:hypothetical protein
VWLYMPVILATQEAETGGSWVLGQPKKRLLDDVRGPRFNSGRQTERERKESHRNVGGRFKFLDNVIQNSDSDKNLKLRYVTTPRKSTTN